MKTPFDLGRAMQALAPGDKVSLQIRRAGKDRTVVLWVGQLPDRGAGPGLEGAGRALTRTFEIEDLPGLNTSLPEAGYLERTGSPALDGAVKRLESERNRLKELARRQAETMKRLRQRIEELEEAERGRADPR